MPKSVADPKLNAGDSLFCTAKDVVELAEVFIT